MKNKIYKTIIRSMICNLESLLTLESSSEAVTLIYTDAIQELKNHTYFKN